MIRTSIDRGQLYSRGLGAAGDLSSFLCSLPYPQWKDLVSIKAIVLDLGCKPWRLSTVKVPHLCCIVSSVSSLRSWSTPTSPDGDASDIAHYWPTCWTPQPHARSILSACFRFVGWNPSSRVWQVRGVTDLDPRLNRNEKRLPASVYWSPMQFKVRLAPSSDKGGTGRSNPGRTCIARS